MELKEVVAFVSGRANDTRLVTNKHKNSFSVDVEKEISHTGFPSDYIEIKAGDSIIKKIHSNTFAIKRSAKVAVYKFNCDCIGYKTKCTT